MKQLYARDSIDVWHAVAFVDDNTGMVRLRCKHKDFVPKQLPVARRPPKGQYCAGCLSEEGKAVANESA